MSTNPDREVREAKMVSPTPDRRPWCCVMECDEEAEWDIMGWSTGAYDSTQACTRHVGDLLDSGWNRVRRIEEETSA